MLSKATISPGLALVQPFAGDARICRSRLIHLPKLLPKYIRNADVEKFFNIIKKARNVAMFKIMLRCGLRLEETANQTKDAVDLERQQRIVYNGKGKKDRVAFISDYAKEKGYVGVIDRSSQSRTGTQTVLYVDLKSDITADLLMVLNEGHEEIKKDDSILNVEQ